MFSMYTLQKGGAIYVSGVGTELELIGTVQQLVLQLCVTS